MTDDKREIPEAIAVIGLGYVGLPVAAAFAAVAPRVVGFDLSRDRVRRLRAGCDDNGQVEPAALRHPELHLTDDPAALAGIRFFVVSVPTPIDEARRPDFGPLREACRIVGPHLSEGAVVVFESTVYPGATEEICGPELAAHAGVPRTAFRLAYSPERINPGDPDHGFRGVVKIVAAEDDPTLERVARTYGAVVAAGIHRAPDIRTAEAAKVIENTQRDINIALMNELAMICDRIGLRTADVLAAAGSKWNFLPFTPGLVGGHCIGVDPYYLTAKAEAVGYRPEVILAGRRINDSMGRVVARKAIQLLMRDGQDMRTARIGVFGLTFKENVPDLRNSRVAELVAELREHGLDPLLADPVAAPEEVHAIYGKPLTPRAEMGELDALILAVGHRAFVAELPALAGLLRTAGLLVDVKSLVAPRDLRADIRYWSL